MAPELQPVKRRVLVADDNVDAADTIALLLQILGCEVCVVNDGESALREAERLRPDVVLIDLGMPGLDGYETCRRLRAQPWGIAMGLVALSGWSREEDRHRSAEAGFDLHLAKSIEPAALMQAVRDVRPLENFSAARDAVQRSVDGVQLIPGLARDIELPAGLGHLLALEQSGDKPARPIS